MFVSGKNKYGLLASPLTMEKSSVPIPIVFPEQVKIVQVVRIFDENSIDIFLVSWFFA